MLVELLDVEGWCEG